MAEATQNSRATLLDIAHARTRTRSDSGRSKPDFFYEIYSKFFDPIRDHRLNLFEIGVAEGESAKVFSEYFCHSNIVGIDFRLKDIDLTGFDNITLFEGDQTDKTFLSKIANNYARSGVDIVIDDASHQGRHSLETFHILYPLLRSGGLYVVEDWGTGYWDKWADGKDFVSAKFDGDRIISHDFGMVGFVKYLIDHTATGDIKSDVQMEKISAMHVYRGVVILEKS
ncbi:MAG: class I SAM-dependent methyltransferase [Paracoccaceae bacterium]